MPDPSVQPPEGLIREIALRVCSAEPGTTTRIGDVAVTRGFHGSDKPCQWCLTDAVVVLAALFDACEVREQWGVEAGPRGTRFWGYASRSEALADIAEGLGDGHTDWVLIRRCDLKTPPEPQINT